MFHDEWFHVVRHLCDDDIRIRDDEVGESRDDEPLKEFIEDMTLPARFLVLQHLVDVGELLLVVGLLEHKKILQNRELEDYRSVRITVTVPSYLTNYETLHRPVYQYREGRR